jgi:hypothetical protein
VDYLEMTTVTEIGGSIILSYNLQVDDGAADFQDIHGVESDSLQLSGLVDTQEGITYGFRYRVRNLYGWSGFSPITYILAADVPSQPPKPTFIHASDNSITL